MNDRPSTTTQLKEEVYLNNAQCGSSKALGTMLNTVTDPVSSSSNQALINSTQGQRPASMQKNVAPFLNKVYCMVDDLNSNEQIRWSTDGKSFFVVRHEDFARSVLPRFFKHSNFSSFVRQLNMYGFHKVPHLQSGVLHSNNESEQWEFSNPHFQRDQPDLLSLVTRKKGRETDEKETPAAAPSTNIDLQHILEEIQVIKQHQSNISSQLKTIQSDNTAMWQETTSSRERHQRHQDTIDKILRFLASVFSNDKSVAISRKRRYLLEAPNTDNNGRNVVENSDNGQPTKVPKTNKIPEFRLEDYVPGLQDFAGVPTPTPTSTSTSSRVSANATATTMTLPTSASSSMKSTNPTSELYDAIALNDKSKQTSSVPSLRLPLSFPQELTQVMSPQQIQGLQSLIGLAQSNPALLSQLTTDVVNTYQHQGTPTNNSISSTAPVSTPVPAYYNSNSLFDPTALDVPNSSNYSSNNNNNNDNTIATILPSLSTLPSLHPPQRQSNAEAHVPSARANTLEQRTNTKGIRHDSPAAIQPHSSDTTLSANTTQIKNESKESIAQTVNDILMLQQAIRSTTRSTGTDTLNFAADSSDAKSSLPLVSTGTQSMSKSADDADGDIDTLGSSIEALVQHFGLTPTKSNEVTLGGVDMDPFLQAYVPSSNSTSTNNMDNIYSSATNNPSNTITASPPTKTSSRNL